MFFCIFQQKMARQTIVIESPKELSLREGMIMIADRETAEEILRPLEDIRMIMIDHHSARITVPLINKLASYNVCVVFCDEKHMPVTMTMAEQIIEENLTNLFKSYEILWLVYQ